MNTITSFFKSVRLPLLFIAFFVFSQNAFAQSFKVVGSKSIEVNSGGAQYIDITNLSGTQLPLTVAVTNLDSHLEIDGYQNGAITQLGNIFTLSAKLDSLGKNHNYIIVKYLTISPSFFVTTLTLTDAATMTTESITIVPADTGVARTKDILSITPPGPFHTHPGQNTIDLVVHNSGTVDAQVQMTTTSKLLTAFPTYFTVPAMGAYDLTLTYNDNSSGFLDSTIRQDSVVLKLMPITPADANPFYFTFWVKDTVKAFFPPNFAIPTFLHIPSGTKVCRTMTITNANDESIDIASLDLTGPLASVFSFDPAAPVFPLTISAHSSAMLTICASAPNDHNHAFSAKLVVNYSSSSHPSMQSTSPVYGSTGDCIGITSDSVTMGEVLAGGWVDGETTITNTLNESVTFSDATWDNIYPGSVNSFNSINLNYPFTLAAGESKTAQFHLATKTGRYGSYTANYSMHYTSSDSNCTTRTIDFIGRAINAGDSTPSNLTLFPAQTEVLPIMSSKQTSTLKFRFTNNSGMAMKVVSVSVKDRIHFSVSQVNPSTPATLADNDVLEVWITFDAPQNGFFTDQLIIVTDHALLSQTFDLQGLRTGALAVDGSAEESVTLTLSPNPARDNVSVRTTGIRTANFELLDMLGATIAEHRGATEWNISALTGNSLTAGSYFIRASGITNDGASFVNTKKLVITK